MRRARWWGWKFLAWTVGCLLFLLLIVLPLTMTLLISLGNTVSGPLAGFLAFAENLIAGVMMAFAAAWVFFLGGSFASFLNVVAARVPQGRSILGSSHCPYLSLIHI